MQTRWTIFLILTLSLFVALTGAVAATQTLQSAGGLEQMIGAGGEPLTIAAPGVADRETLRINIGGYPNVIDPHKSFLSAEFAHLGLIYEGLTRLNDALETIPAAAERWEYSPDTTVLTLTLRTGLTYSDGALLNAMRFRYALLRNIDPTTNSDYGPITDEIIGAQTWRTVDPSRLTPEELAALREAVAVHALDTAGNACTSYAQADCLALRLAFTAPAPYFHTVLSLQVAYPAREEFIAAGGTNWWQSPQYQVGNGPFVLQVLAANQRAYFTPNARYWRGVATYNIEYGYVTDNAAALTAYRQGQFDIIAPNAADMAMIRADPLLNPELRVYSGSCTYAIMFHNLKPPFTDPKVRQAFAYTLNRDAWERDVLGGVGLPTLTWIPPGYPGHDAGENRWAYNPISATQAISDSSYGSIAAMPPITLTFSSSARNQLRNQWLADQWRTVLGISMTLNPVDAATYTQITKDFATAPQTYILGWCADYPDPKNWLSAYWKTGVFSSRIGYSNPILDALLNQADAERDPTLRLQLYAEAQRLLIADCPGAFAWNNVNAFLVKGRVRGVVATPQDKWPGSNEPLAITVESWKKLYLPLTMRP